MHHLLDLDALRRTPSLRSLVLLRCALSPSFAALSPWLRHAVAAPRGGFASSPWLRHAVAAPRGGFASSF